MSTLSESERLFLVVDEIKRKIEAGIYKEREPLPSEFLLAKELGVSRATLREALRILEETNVIVHRHGVGTFVNPKPILTSGIEELSSIHDMIERSGKKASSIYLSTDTILPTEEEREYFAPKDIKSFIQIERVRTADGDPVVFCIEKVPYELLPLEYIYQEDSLYTLMEKYAHKRIAYAVTDIEPISYHDRIFELLNCEPEQSLLLLRQMHYTDEDEPVLYTINYFRPDVFRFHVLRRRPS